MARVMLAAAGSGSGKTVITLALLHTLKRQGIEVSPYKCGPDYIDPLFHEVVTGRHGVNLDSFFSSEEELNGLLSDAKFALIEGVMGIYDGLGPGSIKGSCYEIASLTKTPIILIVNAGGVGWTIASLIKGILEDDTSHLIKGIILNRMSASYFDRIAPHLTEVIGACREDISLIGPVPKDEAFSLGSRHLGLTLPGEITGIREQIEAMAAVMEEHCDTAKIVEIAEAAGPLPATGSAAGKSVPARGQESPLHLAVAKDEAFCFYYRENLRLLQSSGFVLDYFSPLHDEKLPDGVSAILLGGGYPELHLKELEENTSMHASIREAIRSGMPSLAECGGFMYLHRAIRDPEGKTYEMAGCIDGICTYAGHSVNFGYTEVTGVAEELFKQGGLCQTLIGARGHEFHYYESSSPGVDLTFTKASAKRTYAAGYAGPNHLWGFAHIYYPSAPDLIRAFAEEARRGVGNTF